jgi:cation:H+ antiporter
MPDFSSLPLWQNLAIIVAGGAVVWIAGTRLSNYADQIAKRTRLTDAITGLLLLGFATSLPEVATTLTASLGGNAQLATSNLLGGVAMQTTVLAIADAVAVRGALTYFAPKPVLLMQAVVLILLLALVCAAAAAGTGLSIAGVGLGSMLLIVVYVLGVFITERFERRQAWEAVNPPDKPVRTEAHASYDRFTHRRLYLSFAAASLLILVSGWAVTKASEAVAEQTGVGATFIGATLLAITTSLPELSTTIQAVRLGAYAMAISNVFGSNCIDTAMLFVADIGYRQGPILAETTASTTFTAGLAIVVTCIYLWGLLERENRSIGRLGWDSMAVVLVYLSGLWILYGIG